MLFSAKKDALKVTGRRYRVPNNCRVSVNELCFSRNQGGQKHLTHVLAYYCAMLHGCSQPI